MSKKTDREAEYNYQKRMLQENPEKILAIFNKNTIKSDQYGGCHIWNMKTRNGDVKLTNGYPRFGQGLLSPSHTTYARRYIYETKKGKIPPKTRIKMSVNCHPLCVNPKHMFLPGLDVGDINRIEVKWTPVGKQR